jgi:O-antigen ligase
MAPVAYFLCWILIVVLMLNDSRRRTGVSAACWIPTVMLFTLLSRSPAAWLGVGAARTGWANQASGDLIDQIFYASAILAAFIVICLRRVNWWQVLSANAAIMLFYGYFLVSPLWAFYPVGSLIRLLKVFGCTIVTILVILSEKKPLEAMRAVYARCACVLIPLSAMFVRFTSYGKAYDKDGNLEFIGAADQKNSLGEMLLVLIIFQLWDQLEERASAKGWWRRMPWDRLLLIGTGAWLLRLSQSQTSFLSLVLGLALVLRSGWLSSQRISKAVFAVALSLPLLVLGIQEFKSVFTPILEMLGRDATFTGRTNIWAHISWATVNPLVGAGFWNFWGSSVAKTVFDAPNAHNGYLDVYIDGGIIGVFLMSWILFTTGRRLLKNLPLHRHYRLAFAFLVIVIVHNIAETSFARPSPLWFTMLLMVMRYPPLTRDLTPVSVRGSGRAELEEEPDLMQTPVLSNHSEYALWKL